MVELIAYTAENREETIPWVQDFFGFHRSLLEVAEAPETDSEAQAAAALEKWSAGPDRLFIIHYYEKSVGFLHIRARGPNAIWIEDIYVDRMYRGQGIASQAIVLAENSARADGRYDAICIDVSPRNSDALRLYHRLGYVDLSLITVRKELQEDNREKRDRKTDVLGFEFRY